MAIIMNIGESGHQGSLALSNCCTRTAAIVSAAATTASSFGQVERRENNPASSSTPTPKVKAMYGPCIAASSRHNRQLIIRSAVQQSAGFGFVHAAPLLEEEADVGRRTLPLEVF